MLTADSVSTLVGLIYEAAQQPSAWEAFVEQLTTTTRATQSALIINDAREHSYNVEAVAGIAPETRSNYQDRYAAIDEWITRGRHFFRPGYTATSQMLRADEDLVKTEFFNDYLHTCSWQRRYAEWRVTQAHLESLA